MPSRAWTGAAVFAALAAVPMLRSRASSPTLLQDTDTVALLAAIRERQAPLSWFAGDWPLANHFYRPISTLTFEVDNALYRNQAWGYGLTNLFIALVAVAALFWLLRELTESPVATAFGTGLFALWTANAVPGVLLSLGTWLPLLAFTAGWLLAGKSPWPARLGQAIVPALLTWLLFREVSAIQPLVERMIGWLPGRTASVMTVFTLLALAGYARSARLAQIGTDRPWLWLTVGLVATALALGSYEQAVMLPACLVAMAVHDRLRQRPVVWSQRWWAPAGAWVLLVGYLLLRQAVVPSEVSGYQAQQFRDGPGVFLSATDYVFPALGYLPALWSFRDLGAYVFFTDLPGNFLLHLAAWVFLFLRFRQQPWGQLALLGWVMSSLAFLPMAWMKPFEHYHYWPMALRTLLVLGIAGVLGQTYRDAFSALLARGGIISVVRPAPPGPTPPGPGPGWRPSP